MQSPRPAENVASFWAPSGCGSSQLSSTAHQTPLAVFSSRLWTDVRDGRGLERIPRGRRARHDCAVRELSAEDFQALGVYDPGAPHAAEKLELLEYLVSLGATAEDLTAHRDELPGLATIVSIRGGRAMTLSEAAREAGVSEATLLRINRATGLPTPDPEARTFGPQIAGLAGRLAAAEAVFGQDLVPQLVRVTG